MANPNAGVPQPGDDASVYGYPNRSCRICFSDVAPRFRWVPAGLLAYIFSPTIHWADYDANGCPNRLFRPCRCSGSIRYIHEECLDTWRNAAGPRSSNYSRCPTCGYSYLKKRLKWGNLIKGTIIQAFLVSLILLGLICAMGFAASPIINYWLEPEELDRLIGPDGLSLVKQLTGTPLAQTLSESRSIGLHFIKGFASLGILGFIRTLLLMSPFTWFNARAGALAGGRNRRFRNPSSLYMVLVVGWLTILFPVYIWVKEWTRETLEMFSDKIVDVQGYDNPYDRSD